MIIGGEQFHARTKFIRQFTSMESKLTNHKDAAFKKLEKGTLLTVSVIL